MIIDEKEDCLVKSGIKKAIPDITTRSAEGQRILRKMEGILNRPKPYCTDLLESALVEITDQYYTALDSAGMNESFQRQQDIENEIEDNQIKAARFKNLLKDNDMRLFEYIYNRAEWFAGAEHQNVLTGVLCHISTMNGKPIWFLPIGRAGEGKSFIEEASLLFIPKSHIVNGLKTKAVLFRLSIQNGSNYLDRKILTMGDLGEKEDYMENRAVLKTYKKLTTDGHDDYEIAGDGIDKVTGERILLQLQLVGNPSVCFTSVQSETIDDQFLSRAVTVTPTATNDEATRFIKFMEDGMSSKQEYNRIIEEEMPLFHGFVLNTLHEHKDDLVLNPYFDCLSDWLETSEFKKRELGKYKNLVKVVTILHADEREFIINNEGKKLYLSTQEDNQIIARIFNPSTGLSGDAIKVFNKLLGTYKMYNPDDLREYNSDTASTIEDYTSIFSVGSARKRLKNSKRFRGLPMGDIFSSLSKAHLDAVGKVRRSNNNVYAITEDNYQKIKSDTMDISDEKIKKYLEDVLPYYDTDTLGVTSEILQKVENENKVPELVLDKMNRSPSVSEGCHEGCLKGV